MQDHVNFYPVKITSRSVQKKRARRVSWMVLGASVGMSCVMSVSASVQPSLWMMQLSPQKLISANVSPEVVADNTIIGTGTTAPSVNVSALAINNAENFKNDNAAAEAAPVALSTDAEKEIAALEQKAAQPLYPLALDLKVENGDTLSNILVDTGVSSEEAQNLVASVKHVYNPRDLNVGQHISLQLDNNPAAPGTPMISSLKIPVSLTATIEVARSGEDFAVKKIEAPVERTMARAGGRINSSLYETGVSSGLPVSLLSELITAYSYDVDFQREIQPGNNIDVLFESMKTNQGVTAGHGNVLYAELKLDGRTLKIFRYEDKSGNVDYYNEKGESVRKALLRTPINGARITSGFGKRTHPILGYTKMHRGVDFGAPSGTPIYAAGDGVVSFASKKGGYGNYLMIKHNNQYTSAYGHVSKFATGMTPGKKVKQGQVVAYVGSTGMSTGPHLHYEILMGGAQVNPNGIKFKTGTVLAGKELASFKRNMESLQATLNATPRARTDLAMADVPSTKN